MIHIKSRDPRLRKVPSLGPYEEDDEEQQQRPTSSSSSAAPLQKQNIRHQPYPKSKSILSRPPPLGSAVPSTPPALGFYSNGNRVYSGSARRQSFPTVSQPPSVGPSNAFVKPPAADGFANQRSFPLKSAAKISQPRRSEDRFNGFRSNGGRPRQRKEENHLNYKIYQSNAGRTLLRKPQITRIGFNDGAPSKSTTIIPNPILAGNFSADDEVQPVKFVNHGMLKHHRSGGGQDIRKLRERFVMNKSGSASGGEQHSSSQESTEPRSEQEVGMQADEIHNAEDSVDGNTTVQNEGINNETSDYDSMQQNVEYDSSLLIPEEAQDYELDFEPIEDIYRSPDERIEEESFGFPNMMCEVEDESTNVQAEATSMMLPIAQNEPEAINKSIINQFEGDSTMHISQNEVNDAMIHQVETTATESVAQNEQSLAEKATFNQDNPAMPVTQNEPVISKKATAAEEDGEIPRSPSPEYITIESSDDEEDDDIVVVLPQPKKELHFSAVMNLQSAKKSEEHSSSTNMFFTLRAFYHEYPAILKNLFEENQERIEYAHSFIDRLIALTPTLDVLFLLSGDVLEESRADEEFPEISIFVTSIADIKSESSLLEPIYDILKEANIGETNFYPSGNVIVIIQQDNTVAIRPLDKLSMARSSLISACTSQVPVFKECLLLLKYAIRQIQSGEDLNNFVITFSLLHFFQHKMGIFPAFDYDLDLMEDDFGVNEVTVLKQPEKKVNEILSNFLFFIKLNYYDLTIECPFTKEQIDVKDSFLPATIERILSA